MGNSIKVTSNTVICAFGFVAQIYPLIQARGREFEKSLLKNKQDMYDKIRKIVGQIGNIRYSIGIPNSIQLQGKQSKEATGHRRMHCVAQQKGQITLINSRQRPKL